MHSWRYLLLKRKKAPRTYALLGQMGNIKGLPYLGLPLYELEQRAARYKWFSFW